MRPPEAIGHYDLEAPQGMEPTPPPEVPRSPRAIAWTRRRLSAKRIWATYRKNRLGMIGLIVLIFFIAVAVFAPLIASKDGLDPTCTCTGLPLQPPSLQFRSARTTSADPCSPSRYGDLGPR